MCGHGTIGTITIAIEEGLVTPKVPGKIKMEAPAGLVEIEYQQTGKKVDWVRLTNVKSYLTIRDVSHMLWTGDPLDPSSSGRNAVFYGDKAIDRSPCGTGTSARLAQLHAKGKLKVGEDFIHESYIGSKFIGRLLDGCRMH
uniref:trans-L-3-hydroxyproline dehydratase n=1 Tax=Hucho hucho TaxID=62062 RepID=A0A4W5KYL5_9TELE